MNKVKFEIEFPIHASPSMLYQLFSTPSGLEEWFADKEEDYGPWFDDVSLLRSHDQNIRKCEGVSASKNQSA